MKILQYMYGLAQLCQLKFIGKENISAKKILNYFSCMRVDVLYEYCNAMTNAAFPRFYAIKPLLAILLYYELTDCISAYTAVISLALGITVDHISFSIFLLVNFFLLMILYNIYIFKMLHKNILCQIIHESKL